MKKIKIWGDNPSDGQLTEVRECLDRGGVVLVPTDTLYGLVCLCTEVKAVEKICRHKGIKTAKNTLSVICSDISMASEYSRIDNASFKMLRELTPGPFTFIFKAAGKLPKAFKERKTIGIRIPDSNTARKVAETVGVPLMTTSIHFEDDDHARNPELIAEAYESLADLMLEGEEGDIVPSTIVDCTGDGPEIVREGKGEL